MTRTIPKDLIRHLGWNPTTERGPTSAGDHDETRDTNMAVISMFYGIIISMYFLDNRRHKSPHIHVKYQEHEAVVVIPDGTVLEGSLPSSKMKLVQAWMEIHKDELMADWELASTGRGVFTIEPLR